MEFVVRTTEQRMEQRVTVAVDIANAEPIPWRWTSAGKTWRPTGVRVTFERERWGSQPWGPFRAMSGRVTGVNILSSGQPGALRDERLSESANPTIREYVASLSALLTEQGPEALTAVERPEPVEQPPPVG